MPESSIKDGGLRRREMAKELIAKGEQEACKRKQEGEDEQEEPEDEDEEELEGEADELEDEEDELEHGEDDLEEEGHEEEQEEDEEHESEREEEVKQTTKFVGKVEKGKERGTVAAQKVSQLGGQLLSRLQALNMRKTPKRTLFNALFAFSYLLALFSWATTVSTNPPYQLTMFLFHRMLGAVYVIAFVSTYVQILGLIGENGILPLKDTMKLLNRMRAKKSFPTIFFWVGTSDSVIQVASVGGLVASLLYFLNILPTLSLATAWLLFLSFKVVGREFFALQFDNLLLDTGFLAFLLPPFRILPFLTLPTTHFYQQSVLWLVRWLGFRLMVGSGLCKITSGDPTWRKGTALCYHYWSQPMPSWISYYADRTPSLLFHRFCCYYHFFVELVAPYGLFFSVLQMPSFLIMASLQVGIMVTGNYGHFNLLSILIPFAAVTDDWYPSSVYRFFSPEATPIANSLLLAIPLNAAVVALVVGVLVVSLVPFVQATRGHLYFPEQVADIHSKISPFGILNYYGLFAKMTTSRRDVIVEGSSGDGGEWKEYEFRYKVDNPYKLPRFVIGHLPRLDWRLWFCQFQQFNPVNPGWYEEFVEKLLRGSPEVLSLLSKNPFPDKPPRYIRSMMYDYVFADHEERKQGLWWHRSNRKLWWPPCALSDDGRMMYVMKSALLS